MHNLNTFIEIASISTLASVFAVVWVLVLTTPQAIFGKLPNYYGNGILNRILPCEMCLSGWLSMIYFSFLLIYTLCGTNQSYLSDFKYYLMLSVVGLVKIALSGAMGIYIAAIIRKPLER